MKMTKILSFVAGISLLAATLLPAKVSAASAAMSLSGATQANGNFSTMVYETSDGPVSSVKLALNFSTAVTDVNYDFSAGVFTTTDPDGYHLSRGAVTGKQPVARVSFKLANPGSVTASINTGASEVKGPNESNTGVVYYAVGNASDSFTYNAPAPAPAPTNNTPAPTTKTTPKTTATNNTAASNGTVAGEETETPATTAATDDKKKDDTKKSDDKKTDDKKASSNMSWFWILAIVAALAGYVAARRYRTAQAAGSKTDKPVVAPVVAKPAEGKRRKGSKVKSNK